MVARFKAWLCFFLAFVLAWCLILGCILPMHLYAWMRYRGATRLPERTRFANAWHLWWGAKICTLTHALLGIRIRWIIPPIQAPPCLVLANHESTLDVPELIALALRLGIPELRWIAKIQARAFPIVGWMTMMTGCAYVQRTGDPEDLARVRAAGERARVDGASIALFYQGTRGGKQVKTGGFWTLLDAMPTHRILSVGLFWDPPMEGGRTALHAYQVYGRTLTIAARLVSPNEDYRTHAWLASELDRLRAQAADSTHT